MDCTEAIVEFCPGNVFTILLSEKYVGIPIKNLYCTRLAGISCRQRIIAGTIFIASDGHQLEKWHSNLVEKLWTWLKALVLCGTWLDFPRR